MLTSRSGWILPDAETIAWRQRRPCDAFAVHERAVGAAQIDDFERVAVRLEAAVQA